MSVCNELYEGHQNHHTLLITDIVLMALYEEK